jgi:hypothetical protein
MSDEPYSVWVDLGRPDDWNPKVKRALELIRAIYVYAPTGGPLHVILDDWNIDDGFIAHAIEDERDGYQNPMHWGCNPYEDYEDYEEQELRASVRELLPLLGEMTVNERASALARHWGDLPTATEA